MKQLRVLMASSGELVESIFRKGIEEGGWNVGIISIVGA
jgi:hypothetical protein